MKEIVITNPNGITLHTKKSLVDDDIKIKLGDEILNATKGIEGVEITAGPYGSTDLIIDGSKDFSGIVVDGYNGNLLINNSGNREQHTNVNIAGFVNVNLNDEHEYNLITSKDLEPQNILAGKNILGTEGTIETYDYSVDEGGDSYTQEDGLIEGTITSYSNDRVTKVGDFLFLCPNNISNNLVSVSFPNAKIIGRSAFEYCKKLVNVNLPKVTTINPNAFKYCTALETIDLPELTNAYDYIFYGCTKIKTVNIPKLTSLTYEMFYQCKELETINCPSVTYTSFRVFGYCDKLKTAYFTKLEKFWQKEFSSCAALTDVYLGYDGILTLQNTNTFENAGTTQGFVNVHVRPEYADQYADATNWSSLIAEGKVVIVGDYKEEE